MTVASRIAVLVVALALSGVVAAPAPGAHACWTIEPVPASTECAGAFQCSCGASASVTGSMTIPLPGGSITLRAGSGGAGGPSPSTNCCATKIEIPAHDDLVPGVLMVQLVDTITGSKESGQCVLDCHSVLFGVFSWGTATCVYSGGPFGLYKVYAPVGSCIVEPPEH